MPEPAPVVVQDIQPGSETSPPPYPYAYSADDPGQKKARHRYWLFFGGDGGYAGLNTSVPGEIYRAGDQLGLKVVGSFYFDSPWVLDLGAGWERTQVQSRVDYSTAAYSYQEVAGLITRAGFAELQTRYRFGDHVQLGPFVGMMFGTDLSFAPAFNPNTTSNPLLMGGQFFYELTNDDNSWATRLGARASSTLTIPDRQLFALQLSVQFGIPLDSGSRPLPPSPPPPPTETRPVAAQTVAVVDAPAPAPAPPPAAPVVTRKTSPADTVIVKAAVMSVQVTLGSNFVNFATAKADITSRFAAYLDQLAKALNETRDSWKNLVVAGHTDIRGSHEYNMRLSAKRATVVAHALVLRGVPADRINTEHYGPDRPIDPHNNAYAWALNRRVEIKILGVDNSEKLAARLRQLTPIGPDGAPDPITGEIRITEVKSEIMSSHPSRGRRRRRRPIRHRAVRHKKRRIRKAAKLVPLRVDDDRPI